MCSKIHTRNESTHSVPITLRCETRVAKARATYHIRALQCALETLCAPRKISNREPFALCTRLWYICGDTRIFIVGDVPSPEAKPRSGGCEAREVARILRHGTRVSSFAMHEYHRVCKNTLHHTFYWSPTKDGCHFPQRALASALCCLAVSRCA